MIDLDDTPENIDWLRTLVGEKQPDNTPDDEGEPPEE